MTHGDAATAIRREEAAVEARSAALAKELGLIDLTLTQVLFIVGLPWVGVAAKLGPSHVIFWLIAMVFFYVPSAVVVICRNSRQAVRSSCTGIQPSASSTERRIARFELPPIHTGGPGCCVGTGINRLPVAFQ